MVQVLTQWYGLMFKVIYSSENSHYEPASLHIVFGLVSWTNCCHVIRRLTYIRAVSKGNVPVVSGIVSEPGFYTGRCLDMDCQVVLALGSFGMWMGRNNDFGSFCFADYRRTPGVSSIGMLQTHSETEDDLGPNSLHF